MVVGVIVGVIVGMCVEVGVNVAVSLTIGVNVGLGVFVYVNVTISVMVCVIEDVADKVCVGVDVVVAQLTNTVHGNDTGHVVELSGDDPAGNIVPRPKGQEGAIGAVKPGPPSLLSPYVTVI